MVDEAISLSKLGQLAQERDQLDLSSFLGLWASLFGL